jgi:hypothetical protein
MEWAKSELQILLCVAGRYQNRGPESKPSGHSARNVWEVGELEGRYKLSSVVKATLVSGGLYRRYSGDP